VLLATPIPAMPPAGAETVIVSLRYPYPICLGACPSYEVRVSPEGRVTSRRFSPGSRDGSQEGFIARYRATPVALRGFRHLLSSLHPDRDTRADRSCDGAVPRGVHDPLAELADPRPDDVDISWSGPGRTVHLYACRGNPSVNGRLARALMALRLSPLNGYRIDRRGAEINLPPRGRSRHGAAASRRKQEIPARSDPRRDDRDSP